MNNILTDHSRLGCYWVGTKPFFNKTDALMAATISNESVRWDFNDNVYSSFDWSIPITASLSELYRQRAQQLRDRYDYVSLFFSGGVDSGNILHAFIDNDILLDEIIILRPKCLESTFNITDTSNSNLFSETEFAALPHLRKYVKDTRTKIRIIYMDDAINWLLSNEPIVSQFQIMNHFMTHMFSRLAINLSDSIWNNLYSSGKNVCHIHGIDKPIIRRIDNKYSFHFLDLPVSAIFSVAPQYHSSLTEMICKHQFHELFYWTPDLPQLVIKQCQVIKAVDESDFPNPFFQHSEHWGQDKFAFMHPWIYPPAVIELRNLFHTEKGGLDLYAPQHRWFAKMPYYTKGVFNDIVGNMQNSIDDRFFRGLANTNCYLGEPDTGSPKTSFRTIRSKEYML